MSLITVTTTVNGITGDNAIAAAARPGLILSRKPNLLTKQPSQLSLHNNSRAPSKFNISCKATNNNNDIITNDGNDQLSNTKVDRRNMLLGLGGFYGAAATTLALGGAATAPSSEAAPLVANVSACQPTNNDVTVFGEVPGLSKETCCLNFPAGNIKEFRFQDYAVTTTKIRREAHYASANDTAYVNDYKRALTIMKGLPASDPRSFEMQRLIHCAYCDGTYTQTGFPNRNFRIHYSSLFAPFHRWYLYFFERILGSLIGKPDFALPYWSWDNPKSMTIPPMFQADKNSPLYDANRNQKHVNRVVDLNFAVKFDDPNADNVTDGQLIDQNLGILTRSMNEKNKQLFFGGKYKAGDAKADQLKAGDPKDNFGGGTLEDALHNGVHAWVNGDMGYYSTGGKDPLFYAHHANLDRMWSIWKSLGEGRQDLNDADYLGASFVFWDENRKPVRVYVRDCLDNKKLGYNYECNYLPWNNTFPNDCENVGGGWGGGGGGWGGGGGGRGGGHGGWGGGGGGRGGGHGGRGGGGRGRGGGRGGWGGGRGGRGGGRGGWGGGGGGRGGGRGGGGGGRGGWGGGHGGGW